ncbi:GlsB/YeaQ/YmgE family stress response membrane protein [Allofranklinella schreckenbergeri]|uniref:GlsB/YeaQ/YmgE family stress response membrane protein n=1 Tax=Allofranklinella schreckenbergeri TaxID=1076744 RepID=A0A3M6PXZ8_9BURK|nr:GlsB/YeaQ/YmgE family stress response membrane protein [Allofranklinella schreckenbergeri]RMW95070.1 GlsB/YeaQ/YmgE family stress response membrane protein [Allofranklinella schreckenbergeri]RMW97714.1 GlsB/YeaQ/YmgE family stress response membrane protein [Allofranklinella schreckenbergeri]RRD42669.1 GlsB/YeaQ/YmgE family stress response membrane protein [Comamonadaceae bacterium OH3737_COT-264]
MSIIWTILIGLVVGLIARALKPGRDALGWIMTAVLGIAGAFFASFVGQQLNFYGPGEPAGFVASVLGAIVLLILWGMLSKKK